MNDNTRQKVWRLTLAGIAGAALCAGIAWADYTVNAGEPIVVSDDVFDLTTEVVSLTGGPAISGIENNGHGNNIDGVDSSNPGQGNGGPNGDTAESCDGPGECVDDESNGGGASPSQGGGNPN